LFVPTYSAFTRKHEGGQITLTICVEGFDSVLEAREFLHFFVDEDVADDMQEGLN
tara:strand:- start:344 stop:508 length:165 start_codon:yes stop_codon:yes gene_type:complete